MAAGRRAGAKWSLLATLSADDRFTTAGKASLRATSDNRVFSLLFENENCFIMK